MDEVIQVVNQSDVFGNIVSYCMPVPGIYEIKGEIATGYAVLENNCLHLPEAILKHGQAVSGIFLFCEKSSLLIEYELLKHRAKESRSEISDVYFQFQLSNLEQIGMIDFPGVFGETPPPNRTPKGIVKAFSKIRNGIYIVKSQNDELLLAVSDPIAETELSTSAGAFGTRLNKEYVFFHFPEAAAPVFFELSALYEDVANIVSKDLNAGFTSYIREYNHAVYDKNKIPVLTPSLYTNPNYLDKGKVNVEPIW